MLGRQIGFWKFGILGFLSDSQNFTLQMKTPNYWSDSVLLPEQILFLFRGLVQAVRDKNVVTSLFSFHSWAAEVVDLS